MKIVIAGAGAVGTHLARMLSNDRQDVVLIDADEGRLFRLGSELDIMTLVKQPSSIQGLKDAEVHRADLFIAVTPNVSENLTCAMLAKQLGAKQTVARVDNYEYMKPESLELFKNMGIESLIYPELLAAEDIKACIKFVEEKTGAKWNWDAYFTNMKRFNMETGYELEKWEVNKTPYPQIIGPAYELFRKWNYEMDGGSDPRVPKTFRKVDKIMKKAYERREEAWRGKMKYRGIVWSCPAHYYANFSNWIANCWGVDILVEMESLNFTKPLETEDKELALQDLARLYERMVMRRHTNGGYRNVVDELWRQCEAWNVDLIIMYQNVACKNMSTLQGILDEQARDKGYHMIWIEHDLMDPRTVSRKSMRAKVNEYMRTVMKAEPVDPSLVEFDDENAM